MLSRTQKDHPSSNEGIDEQTRALVKSVFNENTTRMIDGYEQKV
jgi:hypothetical protein